jgi:poly(3-hydroxybutyrate) depolymerase
MRACISTRAITAAVAVLGIAGCATTEAPKQMLGVACEAPPPLHCPAGDCPGALIADLGNATDPKTGRKFFLDYPCNLKRGDKLTFVLNLHGGGSIGNWQRHYFPIMDLKEKYKLIVATPSGTGPNGGTGGWNPEKDDQHLRNIVDMVYEQFGAQNIKAFWLAGHSLGGQTSNRLINANFYRDRLVGWVSLSGGRLGSKREDVRAAIPAGTPPPGAPAREPRQPPAGGAAPLGLVADASVLPSYAFTHIYSSGEHELTAAGLPANSKWAEKLKCDARARKADVVDTQAGYVYDSRAQANPNKIWGLKPRPGRAEVFVYGNCENGKLVADVIRMDKGHTEGLEPKVTEEIVKMMLQAK